MTLTHLMPSLRRTLPDPLRADLWPEFTVATIDDVVTAGVSAVRLADLCGTPCVHTAAAVIPGTHGRPSPSALAAVLVTEVNTVDSTGVRVDAELSSDRLLLHEARLIGRASTARDEPVDLRWRSGSGSVTLPADIRQGDLLVIPCRGVITLHEVTPG